MLHSLLRYVAVLLILRCSLAMLLSLRGLSSFAVIREDLFIKHCLTQRKRRSCRVQRRQFSLVRVVQDTVVVAEVRHQVRAVVATLFYCIGSLFSDLEG